ncbi:MAG: hypothetical protein AAFN79_06580 [Pseudomonadota bacterium]
MKNGWHTLRSETSVTVARRLPPRFDVEARAPFPPARKGRLAHLVRQDLWRALQSVRGFTPVVEVAEDGTAMTIRAGGQVAGRAPASLSTRIAAVIEDDANRRRWLRDTRLETGTAA